jgi:hypothetical protein
MMETQQLIKGTIDSEERKTRASEGTEKASAPLFYVAENLITRELHPN